METSPPLLGLATLSWEGAMDCFFYTEVHILLVETLWYFNTIMLKHSLLYLRLLLIFFTIVVDNVLSKWIFFFLGGGGGVFCWLKKLRVKEIWPYQRVTGSNCDANPLYIPVFLITEARSSNFKKINCSQSPIFSGGHLCFICTERPGVGVCSGPPLLSRFGTHPRGCPKREVFDPDDLTEK